MKQVMQILSRVLSMGGDDAIRSLQQGLKAGLKYAGRGSDDVARLLAGTDDFLAMGKAAASSGDDITRAVVKSGDDAMVAMTKSAGSVTTTKNTVQATSTHVVKPTRELSPVEKKIASIKERLKGPQETYNTKNAAFRKAQQVHIDKFTKYVDDYSSKYKELVAKLDDASDPNEVATIKKQLKKLEAQAEKTMKQRLEKLGTLTPDEVQAKITEAKNLVQTRVQNATFAASGTNGLKAEAEKLINEVTREINTYGRDMTPEQLEKIITMKLAKIEKLAYKARFEAKKINIDAGGMKIPLGIDLGATDEIAKLTGGKTPKEAVEHYRTLQLKIREAINKLNNSNGMSQEGYIQLVEDSISIPLKDAPKSKELIWLEQQLKEKMAFLEAETKHATRNCMTAIG